MALPGAVRVGLAVSVVILGTSKKIEIMRVFCGNGYLSDAPLGTSSSGWEQLLVGGIGLVME